MRRSSILQPVFCAMFAALTAVCAQLSVPIGPVPISLATLAVYLAGAVLGGAGGAVSQLLYVLLGAAGLPVFAGFHGGIQALLGPTGGYLAGYAVLAWIVGGLGGRFGRKALPLAASMVLGTAVLYALGTVWFLLFAKRGLRETLLLCVVPFLPGDAAKIAAAAAVAPRLGKAFDRICAGTA